MSTSKCDCPRCPVHVLAAAPRSITVRILEIVPRNRHRAWRKAFAAGIIENVTSILEDCHAALRSSSSNENWRHARVVVGLHNSPQWHEFVFKVFEKLIKSGFFEPHESDNIFTCEDTAGGCDEVIWDAACDLTK